jgi:hypothetical protein
MSENEQVKRSRGRPRKIRPEDANAAKIDAFNVFCEQLHFAYDFGQDTKPFFVRLVNYAKEVSDTGKESEQDYQSRLDAAFKKFIGDF